MMLRHNYTEKLPHIFTTGEPEFRKRILFKQSYGFDLHENVFRKTGNLYA